MATFYKSEGALFRRKSDRSPFEIYLHGKWQTYKDNKDNLFVSSIEISKKKAGEMKQLVNKKEDNL